ncbi:MAG TPA: hypothetical protein VFH51_17105, partial [Myxococcota bacterium]|nr:hypothetical protein [Myxococcota bacterium]
EANAYPSEEEKKEVEEQLEECLAEAWGDFDGYKLAKWLDDKYHWECDAPLVEVLEGASSCVHIAHREAVKAWVEANGITPKLAIGQTVSIIIGRQQKETGQIVAISTESAEYTVKTREFLQRNPDQANVKGAVGVVVPFEQCTLIEETVTC